MKKILMNFSENVLSRNQMKAVRGGSDELGEGGGAACPGTYYSTKQLCELSCPVRCICSGTAPNSTQHICS